VHEQVQLVDLFRHAEVGPDREHDLGALFRAGGDGGQPEDEQGPRDAPTGAESDHQVTPSVNVPRLPSV
jgi:hypothetical protein